MTIQYVQSLFYIDTIHPPPPLALFPYIFPPKPTKAIVVASPSRIDPPSLHHRLSCGLVVVVEAIICAVYVHRL